MIIESLEILKTSNFLKKIKKFKFRIEVFSFKKSIYFILFQKK